jgi:hypothetical protein
MSVLPGPLHRPGAGSREQCNSVLPNDVCDWEGGLTIQRAY